MPCCLAASLPPPRSQTPLMWRGKESPRLVDSSIRLPWMQSVRRASNGYIINYIIDKLSFPSYLFILRHFSTLSLSLYHLFLWLLLYCYCCCLFIHFLTVQQQLQQWRQMFYSR